jgi:hypothetical protein
VLTEVALLIAQADDPEVATERGEAVVERLLSGLFDGQPSS